MRVSTGCPPALRPSHRSGAAQRASQGGVPQRPSRPARSCLPREKSRRLPLAQARWSAEPRLSKFSSCSAVTTCPKSCFPRQKRGPPLASARGGVKPRHSAKPRLSRFFLALIRGGLGMRLRRGPAALEGARLTALFCTFERAGCPSTFARARSPAAATSQDAHTTRAGGTPQSEHACSARHRRRRATSVTRTASHDSRARIAPRRPRHAPSAPMAGRSPGA